MQQVFCTIGHTHAHLPAKLFFGRCAVTAVGCTVTGCAEGIPERNALRFCLLRHNLQTMGIGEPDIATLLQRVEIHRHHVHTHCVHKEVGIVLFIIHLQGIIGIAKQVFVSTAFREEVYVKQSILRHNRIEFLLYFCQFLEFRSARLVIHQKAHKPGVVYIIRNTFAIPVTQICNDGNAVILSNREQLVHGVQGHPALFDANQQCNAGLRHHIQAEIIKIVVRAVPCTDDQLFIGRFQMHRTEFALAAQLHGDRFDLPVHTGHNGDGSPILQGGNVAVSVHSSVLRTGAVPLYITGQGGGQSDRFPLNDLIVSLLLRCFRLLAVTASAQSQQHNRQKHSRYAIKHFILHRSSSAFLFQQAERANLERLKFHILLCLTHCVFQQVNLFNQP